VKNGIPHYDASEGRGVLHVHFLAILPIRDQYITI